MSRFEGPVPELGNLAWAPISSADGVEIFDRFNGVPSLGVVRAGSKSYIFWRAAFYLEQTSLWLYVPLSGEDLAYVNSVDAADLLDGIVFTSSDDRFATVGVAYDNRLVFEREWALPNRASGEDLCRSLIEFVLDSLTISLEQDPPIPPTRRHIVQKASDAVRDLVPSLS